MTDGERFVNWIAGLPPADMIAWSDEQLRQVCDAFAVHVEDPPTTIENIYVAVDLLQRIGRLPHHPGMLAQALKGKTLKEMAHGLRVSARGTKAEVAASIIGRRQSILRRCEHVADQWFQPA